MEKCNFCGNPKKLLLTSWYCDCQAKPEATTLEKKITDWSAVLDARFTSVKSLRPDPILTAAYKSSGCVQVLSCQKSGGYALGTKRVLKNGGLVKAEDHVSLKHPVADGLPVLCDTCGQNVKTSNLRSEYLIPL